MPRLPSLLVVATAAIVGLFVGRMTSSSPRPAAPVTTQSRTVVLERNSSADDSLRSQVRALRDDVARRDTRDDRATGSPNSADKEPARNRDDARTESHQDGHDDVQTLLDNAVSRGRWTSKDQLAMGAVMAKLHRKDARKLISRLIVAINKGDIVPDNAEFLSPIPPKPQRR